MYNWTKFGWPTYFPYFILFLTFYFIYLSPLRFVSNRWIDFLCAFFIVAKDNSGSFLFNGFFYFISWLFICFWLWEGKLTINDWQPKLNCIFYWKNNSNYPVFSEFFLFFWHFSTVSRTFSDVSVSDIIAVISQEIGYLLRHDRPRLD